MSDDLIARAQADSEGVVVPEEWGRLIEVEVGEHFAGPSPRPRRRRQVGRVAGLGRGRRAPVHLALLVDREYERESPTLGDTVVRSPTATRTTRPRTIAPKAGRRPGLGYGLATEPNDARLPEVDAEPESDDDLPF